MCRGSRKEKVGRESSVAKLRGLEEEKWVEGESREGGCNRAKCLIGRDRRGNIYFFYKYSDHVVQIKNCDCKL